MLSHTCYCLTLVAVSHLLLMLHTGCSHTYYCPKPVSHCCSCLLPHACYCLTLIAVSHFLLLSHTCCYCPTLVVSHLLLSNIVQLLLPDTGGSLTFVVTASHTWSHTWLLSHTCYCLTHLFAVSHLLLPHTICCLTLVTVSHIFLLPHTCFWLTLVIASHSLLSHTGCCLTPVTAKH